MKNILLVLIAITAISLSGQAQSLTLYNPHDTLVTPSDTIMLDTAAASSTAIYEMTFYVHNTSNDTLLCEWKRLHTNIPLIWTIQLCDPHYCYQGSLVGYPHTYKLYPHGTGSFQFGITPACNPGTGLVDVLTWVVNDSANSNLTMHWKPNVTTTYCYPAGISDIDAAQITMYPNPVKNTLTVSLPQTTSTAKIDIYNLIGSKVYSKQLNSRDLEQDFDLSALDAGIYVARITDQGKIVTTRRFNKVD